MESAGNGVDWEKRMGVALLGKHVEREKRTNKAKKFLQRLSALPPRLEHQLRVLVTLWCSPSAQRGPLLQRHGTRQLIAAGPWLDHRDLASP